MTMIKFTSEQNLKDGIELLKKRKEYSPQGKYTFMGLNPDFVENTETWYHVSGIAMRELEKEHIGFEVTFNCR